VDEGMDGISTRSRSRCWPRPSITTQRVAADAVHMMYVLEQSIPASSFRRGRKALSRIHQGRSLAPRYASSSAHEIQKAYLESTRISQEPVRPAMSTTPMPGSKTRFKDPDTGQMMNSRAPQSGAHKIEKPAGIAIRRTSATRSSNSRCDRGLRMWKKPRLDLLRKDP